MLAFANGGGTPLLQSAQANGYKTPSEDRILMKHLPDGRLFLGVFDGHGGGAVSELTLHFFREQSKLCPVSISDCKKWLVQKFAELDSKTRRYKNVGTTASVAIVWSNACVVAHVGDSPIILFTGNGKILHKTVDHHPSHSGENTRIVNSGGHITKRSGDVHRVGGILSLSRAIGDHGLKPAVSADPVVSAWTVPAGSYLALMSDGMLESGGERNYPRQWIVNSLIQNHFDVKRVVKMKEASMEGGGDNLSMILYCAAAARGGGEPIPRKIFQTYHTHELPEHMKAHVSEPIHSRARPRIYDGSARAEIHAPPPDSVISNHWSGLIPKSDEGGKSDI
jgi:serine/threonine protein phosphatase PrpC